MIKKIAFTLPLWIGQQGADDYEKSRNHTAEHIPKADVSHWLQIAGRKRVGRALVRRRSLSLYCRQFAFELGKFASEHRHVKPFVHARDQHGPNVYGPRQHCQVGGSDEHLDHHQNYD